MRMRPDPSARVSRSAARGLVRDLFVAASPDTPGLRHRRASTLRSGAGSWLVAVCLAVAAPARAEVQALVAADAYLATLPGAAVEYAGTAAMSAHLEWSGPRQRAVLDGVSREDLFGGPARRELHELSYVDRRLPRLELTLGRFRVPGGFWLIVDGAGAAVRHGRLTAGVFGGSRAFTNGRAETLLTASPAPLPLGGASVTVRGPWSASVAYVATADRVSLYRGQGQLATQRVPEQFLDAELASPLGRDGFVTAGVSLGSRYLVTYPTAAPALTAEPTLTHRWFAAQSAYAMLDYKLGTWRLSGIAAAVRTKLGQVADPALASFSGSYGEGTARAQWRPAPAWRLDARYRLRLWADGRRAQRLESSAGWRRGAWVAHGRLGLDAHHGEAEAPGLGSTRSLFFRASAGHKTPRTELAAGAAATAALGDELALAPGLEARDHRAPYTLEARSFGFVRAFATAGAWFAGFDGEASWRGQGVRALLQLGWSR